MSFSMNAPQNLPASRRERPQGWPVGSFDTYEQAQAAVDMLSDADFPVAEITIVGVDLMEVEKVIGRLSWGRVLLGGAASGAWMGLFVGLLLGIMGGEWAAAITMGMAMGVVFGMIMMAVPYAMSGGRRDFSSRTQIVAGRYDVLCLPERAREARDLIAKFMLNQPKAR